MKKGPIQRFRNWLEDAGYEKVSQHFPGALPAEILIDDYLDDHPDEAPAHLALVKHAKALGYVSQEEWEDPDPDHDIRGEEEDLDGYGF